MSPTVPKALLIRRIQNEPPIADDDDFRHIAFPDGGIEVVDPDTHQHVHVHIPNVGLLAVREVMNLDDACTNSLQSYLDEGWSILAICPPNATRRPDYILGRADKR